MLDNGGSRTTRPRRPWASAVTLVLGLGLGWTTRGAEAETGVSGSGVNLTSLLDEKLARTRAAEATSEARPGSFPSDAPRDIGAPLAVAARMGLFGLGLAGATYLAAVWLRRSRERRIDAALGSNLMVKETVWVGRGQRILLVTFEKHKVLVGVSGGTLHSLGIFGEEGAPVAPVSPIEREAALRDAEEQSTSEFADFVKGELAGTLATSFGTARDGRHKMLSDLNSL